MISVITPTVRSEMLPIIGKCLKRQDFQDFEWLVITPKKLIVSIDKTIGHDYKYIVYPEPVKREGDFYRLSGALNTGFQKAMGNLIVVIMDGIWFPPDLLSRLWGHYQNNPRGLVTTIGHQYDKLDEYGKPTNIVWQDPRARIDQGTFYEVAPSEMEMCVGSIPKQALIDSGGIDEDYDKGPAVGEKEMCFRLDKLGYKFYIDQAIEYRAIHHSRLTKDWDEMYFKVTAPMFTEHMQQLQSGQRILNVGYVSDTIVNG